MKYVCRHMICCYFAHGCRSLAFPCLAGNATGHRSFRQTLVLLLSWLEQWGACCGAGFGGCVQADNGYVRVPTQIILSSIHLLLFDVDKDMIQHFLGPTNFVQPLAARTVSMHLSVESWMSICCVGKHGLSVWLKSLHNQLLRMCASVKEWSAVMQWRSGEGDYWNNDLT